ncbi:response regulator transcription factor [Amycolatopsis sp. NPDC059657]|uniref:response regulator transcription factor n=1 Tax=Amycolatopsis sp. NPDC059657 TaxID=3346899 RepID=UPI003672B8BD
MRVLVTEDDPDIRLTVRLALRTAGLAVDAVPDLPAADEALYVNSYDCAIFDRMLPSGDALMYVSSKRATGWAVPVLFLTARDEPSDVVTGLRAGDDYLVKPFAVEELVVRVRSLCRRTPHGGAAVLRCGDLTLDTGRREVRRAGVLLTLTRTEFAVLERLMSSPGRVVSQPDLLRSGWDEMLDPASNVLQVLMAQLRRKLREPAVIQTVRGLGYRLTPS